MDDSNQFAFACRFIIDPERLILWQTFMLENDVVEVVLGQRNDDRILCWIEITNIRSIAMLFMRVQLVGNGTLDTRGIS